MADNRNKSKVSADSDPAREPKNGSRKRRHANQDASLAPFLPAVRRWFTDFIGEPSPPQVQAWPHIADGDNVLIHAPTGSGKTLAAFLSAINRLFSSPSTSGPRHGVEVLYISPLKALNNDIERNLRDAVFANHFWVRGRGSLWSQLIP